jgi:2-oxoglutarate ferredoxin oxidoreductase subunit beta
VIVYEKSPALTDVQFSYCPGCTHGNVHKLVAESITELGVMDRAIGVAPVGCAVVSQEFFNFDMLQAAHGRAPAVATGLVRSIDDAVVFTYQGDGDLAAIGTAEIIHAAARGENMVVIFVNNAIFGMTGGQMAPTTLPGQKTQTSPYGRDVSTAGFPIKVVEMLSGLDGTAYAERVSLHDYKHLRQAKKAVKKAFQYQVERKGFSIVELLSICPTNWGLDPLSSIEWLKNNMLPYYPLGVFKDAPSTEKNKEGN